MLRGLALQDQRSPQAACHCLLAMASDLQTPQEWTVNVPLSQLIKLVEYQQSQNADREELTRLRRELEGLRGQLNDLMGVVRDLRRERTGR